MKKSQILIIASIVIILVVGLSACKADGNQPTTEGTPAVETTESTPTDNPEKDLTICLGVEPETLYFYKGNGHSMWSVLEAIYDGPMDTVNYTAQPVILQSIPNLTNGGASLQAVTMQAGQIVVDVDGNAVILQEGVRVFPSGCTSLDCAVEWDGVSALSLDRMIANFIIKPGILWSDGEALTADDSVFSYTISADAATPVSKSLVNQTENYQALDERSVQWIGRPGLVTPQLEDYFWIPLPKHQLQGFSAAELQTAAETNTMPMGWGAFMIDEWVPGDHIRLIKNPNYFRAVEGLPKFDAIVYRFVGDQADSNLMAFENGECDVVDQSVAWDTDYQAVRQLELDGKAIVYRSLGPQWEHLDFNIVPASYDDGYNPFGVDRPNLFGDVRVRQAFAYCINRQQIVIDLFNNLTEVPLAYVPPSHPFYAQGLREYPYDPAQGQALLETAGWKDLDDDATTARTAIGISDIANGTTFTITLLTGQAEIRQELAARIATDLQACGVGVTVQSLPVSEFYAAAPGGLLFGRQYDLAEFAWAAGSTPPCFVYMSTEIPNAANNWAGGKFGGVNTMGYSNAEVDAACQAALAEQMDRAAQLQNHSDVQQILAEELPSIPLFYFVNLIISRMDVCGISMDASVRSELWNIEGFDIGTGCVNGQ